VFLVVDWSVACPRNCRYGHGLPSVHRGREMPGDPHAPILETNSPTRKRLSRERSFTRVECGELDFDGCRVCALHHRVTVIRCRVERSNRASGRYMLRNTAHDGQGDRPSPVSGRTLYLIHMSASCAIETRSHLFGLDTVWIGVGRTSVTTSPYAVPSLATGRKLSEARLAHFPHVVYPALPAEKRGL